MNRWITGAAALALGAAGAAGLPAVASTEETHVLDFQAQALGAASLVYTSELGGPIPVWAFDSVKPVPAIVAQVSGSKVLGIDSADCCRRIHLGIGTACGSGAGHLRSLRLVGTTAPVKILLFDRGGNVGPMPDGYVVGATGASGSTTVTFPAGTTGLADDAVAEVVVLFKSSGGWVDDVVFDCVPCDGGEPPPPPPPPTEECDDWFTGGGWIWGTPSGAKGTFGVGGGGKKGALWGHMNYVDHGIGMHVHWDTITGYTALAGTRRRSEGTCTIDGNGGFTYVLEIEDNGEPGRNDWFELRLSNGYVAKGSLDGGGNLQLHKASCGTKKGGSAGGGNGNGGGKPRKAVQRKPRGRRNR